MANSNKNWPKFAHSFRNSALFQRAMRVFQFLSSLISLGCFSARLAKILRLTRQASTSNGAVEGILAAAVLYTLTVMLMKFCFKNGGPKFLRWLLIILDILFVGAFIAVADLTRPKGGSSGPCRNTIYAPVIPKGQNCNLPWATFILAIVSTILHAITAVFHEVQDHRHAARDQREQGQGASHNGYVGVDDGHGDRGEMSYQGHNDRRGV